MIRVKVGHSKRHTQTGQGQCTMTDITNRHLLSGPFHFQKELRQSPQTRLCMARLTFYQRGDSII